MDTDNMGYLVGTDEAGLGPNLGPLLISATVWEVPDHLQSEDLFEHLDEVLTSKPSSRTKSNDDRPVFADSKILYTRGKGWKGLERGLWAALSLLGQKPATGRDLWALLDPDALDELDTSPFYQNFNPSLPRDFQLADDDPIARGEWQNRFERTGVKFLALRSRAVFPPEFNRLMDEHESKGSALSHLTLKLVADLIRPLDRGPLTVLCDKHGGRNRYAPLLAEYFPDDFIEIREEGRAQSWYRFGPADRRIEFFFRAKAESCLPAALASMASKYLRELAMEAFNAFWSARIPRLAPTAGYPQDARRFLADIVNVQRQLGIDDSILWRKK